MTWVIKWCMIALFCSQIVVWHVYCTSGAVASGSLHSSSVHPDTSLFSSSFVLSTMCTLCSSILQIWSFENFSWRLVKYLLIHLFIYYFLFILFLSLSHYLSITFLWCVVDCPSVALHCHTGDLTLNQLPITIDRCHLLEDVVEKTLYSSIYFWQGAYTHWQTKEKKRGGEESLAERLLFSTPIRFGQIAFFLHHHLLLKMMMLWRNTSN